MILLTEIVYEIDGPVIFFTTASAIVLIIIAYLKIKERMTHT